MLGKELKAGDIFKIGDTSARFRISDDNIRYSSWQGEHGWAGYINRNLINDYNVTKSSLKLENLNVGDYFVFNSHRSGPDRVVYKKLENDVQSVGYEKEYPKGVLSTHPNHYDTWEVTLMSDKGKMNIIDALLAMKKGKKMRRVCWKKESFIYLKDERFYSNVGSYDYTLSSLDENGWEEYTLIDIEIKLNNEHTAIISQDGVKVGCQVFPLDKVQELYDAVQKVKENK